MKKHFITLFLALILALTVVVPTASITLIDAVLDEALDKIADDCVVFFVSTDETYANRLCAHTITAGAGNGDFTAIADGPAGVGRALGLTAQIGISGTATGTAAYYGFATAGGGTPYYTNALATTKAIVSGSSYDYDAMTYAIHFKDAVSE